MVQFDNWPPFQDFSFQEFSFPVDRYVVWEAGQMVDSGNAHFEVYFKYSSGGFFSNKVSIEVKVNNNPIPVDIFRNSNFA